MTSKVTAWSYSRYSTYAECPLKFKGKFIDKLKEPESPAMARGDNVHKATAAYLVGGMPLPAEITTTFQKKLLAEVKAHEDKVVEQQWAFDAKWAPTGWFRPGMNGGEPWFRSILDCGVLYEDMSLEALDWKTGKRYGSNDEQMETQAIAAYQHFKPATHVTTRLVYFDAKSEEIAEFPKSDLPKLLDKWAKKVAPMFTDTAFLPRPNDKCRFCLMAKGNGGTCRYG